MKNKPKEPPQIAVKFANMVFVLGILFCVLTAVYASYRIFNPIYSYYLGNEAIKTFYIFSILSGGVFATLFGFGLKKQVGMPCYCAKEHSTRRLNSVNIIIND